MMTLAQRDLLESIANNPRTLNDVRTAIGAALSNDPDTAPPVNAAGIKKSAEVSLMYLQTGFVECPQCGEEVPTKGLDAAYELATVVQPAPTIGGTVRTYPVPEGMKPWTGGDNAPDDWDGGSVLRADGQIEHSDDITIQQWKHPVPRCKWNVVAYTPARVLDLPQPVPATDQAGKVERIEAECARLLAAYITKEIGRIMHQAEHWAANGKPLAVHHRLMKADNYFQILCLMERDPAKGWKLPFDEIRNDLARRDINAPGTYPPSKDLYRYRDPAFVVAALARAKAGVA